MLKQHVRRLLVLAARILLLWQDALAVFAVGLEEIEQRSDHIVRSYALQIARVDSVRVLHHQLLLVISFFFFLLFFLCL